MSMAHGNPEFKEVIRWVDPVSGYPEYALLVKVDKVYNDRDKYMVGEVKHDALGNEYVHTESMALDAERVLGRFIQHIHLKKEEDNG